MTDETKGNPHQIGDGKDSKSYYLKRAKEATDSGDALLGAHLYLAAFERSLAEDEILDDEAIDGLKSAWVVACASKERALAEYILEKLTPFLSTDEMSEFAGKLQDLTLDKLGEYGYVREKLEDIAEMISEELFMEPLQFDGVSAEEETSLALPGDADEDLPVKPLIGPNLESIYGNEENLNYSNLAGYDRTISLMAEFGIGLEGESEFDELVNMLNARHGIDRMPAMDTLVFKSDVREDANRMLAATVGEMGLPFIVMRLEDNMAGMPMLSVQAQSMQLPSSHSLKDAFSSRGVLVLEDIDLWGISHPMPPEEGLPFFFFQLTRGAREALALIESAVRNPDVVVLASAGNLEGVEGYMLDLLEPISVVEIDVPTEEERADIWKDIQDKHPSLRDISRQDLVRYTANMARCDIYLACRDAIDEAYKLGLMGRKYKPVTRENLFDKLAAYQPLDSKEYTELEDEVISNFQSDLNHIDDILGEDE